VAEVEALHAGSTCKSCKRPIVWAVSEKTQKKLPLDPEPVLGGNLHMVGEQPQPYGRPAPLVRAVEPDELVHRFVSHFATCPQADQWRKTDDP
jgi:hypothetical protein